MAEAIEMSAKKETEAKKRVKQTKKKREQETSSPCSGAVL